MIKIESNNAGENLAKVLNFYGLLEDTREYKIMCPWHGDVNPSMKINLNDGSFFCFGCGLSGDALRFVMLANKEVDDLRACKRYYKILRSKKSKGIKLSAKQGTRSTEENKQAIIEAEDYYYGLKSIDWREEDSDLKDYMLGRGFTAEILTKAKAKYTYNNSYPIIFPMYDMKVFKGWVCRTTEKRIEKRRKYLYNEGFSRSNTLVGRYDSETVMVVEGYMDYMKAKMFGVRYVVALLGWKATDNQIKKLKAKGVKYIISALDNDKYGNEGTIYLKKFFEVIRFQYPEDKKDMGDLDNKAFGIANNKTKKLYRRVKDGISRQHQKSGKKVRVK